MIFKSSPSKVVTRCCSRQRTTACIPTGFEKNYELYRSVGKLGKSVFFAAGRYLFGGRHTCCFIVLYVLAGALAPVLTGLVIAFLLQGLVDRLQSLGCPRLLAIVIAMVVLLGSVFAIVLLVVPLVWQQASSLLALAPSAIGMLRDGLSGLAARFPEFITEEQILGEVNSSKELGNLSAFLLESAFLRFSAVWSVDLSGARTDIGFFLLKDKEVLMAHAVSLCQNPA